MVDGELGKKLRRELPGILNIALRGARRWYKVGLKTPALITTAVGKYRDESDIFEAWLKDCARKLVKARWRAGQAYESYVAWAKSNYLKPMSGKAFGTKMGGKFKKHDDKHGAVYLGVGPK
jgi:putative DNA primase/helicase